MARVRPPTGGRVSRVQVGRYKMHGSYDTTPQKQIGNPAENSVLRQERAACLATQQGMDGGMVVKVEVEGGMVSKSSQT